MTTARRAFITALVVALTSLLLGDTAGAAASARYVNHFVGANNLYLDSNITGSRPGRGDAFVQAVSGSDFQRWEWAGTIPSEWVIFNKASGLCLNSTGVDYVYVTDCGGTDSWRIVRPAGGGLPWIVNVPRGNNGCLTMVGADVRTRTCDTRNSTQRWRII
jgi:hypothetical protein